MDLLFLFHHLQEEVAGGAGRGPSLLNIQRVKLFSEEDPPGEKPSVRVLQEVDSYAWGDALWALDLVLALGCSRAGVGVPCGSIHLLHPPFTALFYR